MLWLRIGKHNKWSWNHSIDKELNEENEKKTEETQLLCEAWWWILNVMSVFRQIEKMQEKIFREFPVTTFTTMSLSVN